MDIGRKLVQLENLITQLQRQTRLSHASLDGTALIVKDDAGVVRGRIGMQADGTLGLVAVDGPAPGAPSAPTVTPSISGLRIVWDGTLADGSPLPADFDHVAVHVSTSSGFTPSAATYVGTITRAGDGGMLPVTPLPYTAHYVRLTAVNTSAAASGPSDEVTATPIKVDGPDLEAGSVTAATIEAGAVTADKLEAVLQLATRLVAGNPAGARVELNEDGLRVYNASGVLTIRFDSVDGSGVFTGTITGSTITGGSITGGVIQTAATGQRVTINASGNNRILIYDSGGTVVAELSSNGVGMRGTSGAILSLDAAYPRLRYTNAAVTKAAYLQSFENGSGDVGLELVTSRFSEGAFTDWIWHMAMKNDTAFIERIRDDGLGTTKVGGVLALGATFSRLGFANTADSTQETNFYVQPNVATVSGGRLQVLPVGSALSCLYVEGVSGHTGSLLRLYRSGDKLVVDKDGNLTLAGNAAVSGILSAGSIAMGTVAITPSAANTPTSATVSGLSVQGTNLRAFVSIANPAPGVTGSTNGVTGVGFSNLTSSGVTVWATRQNTTAVTVHWIIFGNP